MSEVLAFGGRHQAQEASALNGDGQRPLVLSTDAGLSCRLNLAPATHKAAEQIGITVIDFFDLVLGKITINFALH